MATTEVSKAQIEKFLELDAKRKTKQREVDGLDRELKPLKEKIRAYVEEQGGSDRTTTHFGFILALVPYRKQQVGWKDEFIAIEGSERAVELQEAMPMTFTLSVEPLAAATTP